MLHSFENCIALCSFILFAYAQNLLDGMYLLHVIFLIMKPVGSNDCIHLKCLSLHAVFSVNSLIEKKHPPKIIQDIFLKLMTEI